MVESMEFRMDDVIEVDWAKPWNVRWMEPWLRRVDEAMAKTYG